MAPLHRDMCVYWLKAGLDELEETEALDRTGWTRAMRLKLAVNFVGFALAAANKARDAARRAVCLRILNWLRADLRRAA